MELCRWLRWKSFYGSAWQTRKELRALLSRNEVPFQCLRNCQVWGPDDGVVSPECCGSHRTCFAPSPRLPPETIS